MNVTFITDPLVTTVGATRPPCLLATELQKNGHSVTLVSLCVSEKVREITKENNIQVRSVGSKFSTTPPLPIFEAWVKSLVKSKSMRYPNALGDNEIVINTSSSIKARSHLYYAQGPMTRALHDMFLGMPKHYNYTYRMIAPLLRFLEKKTVKEISSLSNSVIANSRFCASMYKELDVEVDGVIPPPLDCDLFKPSNSKPSEDYVLTYFGVYNKETKFTVVKEVADAGMPVKAFGYKACGIPGYIVRHRNIEFLGAVSSKELVDLYSNALYVIFTFTHEPFGYIPIESMACGTPVLTYNTQGPSESVMDGLTGWLASGDEKLVDLASKIWRDGYPQKTRKICVERASLFDVKNISQKWIELIRELQ